MSDLPLGSAVPPGARRSLLTVGLLLAIALAGLLCRLSLPLPARLAGIGLLLLVIGIAQARIEAHHPPDRLGAANLVTLCRAAGASLLAAFALAPAPGEAWALAGAAALLIALDGLDGALARRQGLASPFGARFDMEVDALTILALSALVVGLGKAGPWLLGLGLMRYGFVLAGWCWPQLARPLPPSFRRKAICVLQLVLLTVLLVPPVVPPLSTALAALALATLTASFAIDLWWLLDPDWRGRLGLARSLLIYRARPWRTARLARFYAGFLGPGDLAFDIGAHVGNRTCAMRAAGARVVALEPQRRLHAFLRRNLPADVTLLRLAVGAAPGEADLAVSRLHPTVSSIAAGFASRIGAEPGFTHVRWDARETVAVTTLDALIAEHGLPRFVKIDVEGFESEVLRGLGQPVPWIAFEFLPGAPETTEACIARLGDIGPYSFNLVDGEATAFALPHWTDAPGIRAALTRRRRSGDVYARLGDG